MNMAQDLTVTKITVPDGPAERAGVEVGTFPKHDALLQLLSSFAYPKIANFVKKVRTSDLPENPC